MGQLDHFAAPAERVGAAPVSPRGLDLAARGALAINGVLGSLDPDRAYENYFLTFIDVHPAYMTHFGSQYSGVLPKYVEALPLLRFMSGSERQRDLEEGMLNAVIENISDDGLIYDRATPDRPWNVGVGYGVSSWNEDYANMAGNGRLLAGLLYMHQQTGDEAWKRLASRTAERLLELTVVDGEDAYYPFVGLGNDFSYPRKSGWTHTRPPDTEFEGSEGSMRFYQLQPVRGFVRWYQETGDERFLDVSRKLVHFCTRPQFWGGLHDIEPLAGAERGHFWGHFHGTAAAIRAILDYAIAADDYRLKLFARDAYEWARHHGVHRIGVFPTSHGNTEGCTVADMVGLAVRLTDCGVGDYWEDVEHYARNGLLAVQAADPERLRQASEAGRARPKDSPWGGHEDMRFNGYSGVLPGQETIDNVLERAVGSFGHLDGARYLKPRLMHCCTANGSQALYYAWEAITRRSGSSAEVNLWLDRRSPWLDVTSSLPSEGRLVLRNKGVRQIAVRVPAWASASRTRCRVDQHDVNPDVAGNRLLFADLRGNEVVEILAPVATEHARYTIAHLNQRAYGFGEAGAPGVDLTIRGNTVLEVAAPGAHVGGQQRPWYPVFQGQGEGTPDVAEEISRYVHPARVITW